VANGTDLQVRTRGFHGPAPRCQPWPTIYRRKRTAASWTESALSNSSPAPVAPGGCGWSAPLTPVVHERCPLKMGPGPYFTAVSAVQLAKHRGTNSRSARRSWTVRPALRDRVERRGRHGREARPEARRQLDGIGGSTVYGMADSADAFKAENLLPLGLVGGATMTRAVARVTCSPMTTSNGQAKHHRTAPDPAEPADIAENWTDEQTVAAVDKAITAT